MDWFQVSPPSLRYNLSSYPVVASVPLGVETITNSGAGIYEQRGYLWV